MGMKQYVNKPTRITKESKSIIELIFSNKEIEISVIREPMITDHACLKIEQEGGRIENKYRKNIARDYSEIDQFVETMENRLEHNRNMNVNERATRLVNNMVQACGSSKETI